MYYFFVMFIDGMPKLPLAISPVDNYVAPDAVSSWTALGIKGYVLNYNERLTRINHYLERADMFGPYLDLSLLPENEKMVKQTYDATQHQGKLACAEYNDYLAATYDALVAGCAQLKVSLPKHGKTVGMKRVYMPGMDIPNGCLPQGW